ncbi:transcriptional regulator [Trinickia violacea]|uniref:Transcriptional regulator n=1 Tax=Trinickia violacea TaxID=2571746 RepID=A0A4P8IWL6_9BURK|nr:winged helix-turn-helix domain-containing protein [Trinickia violacea]QCP52285.1 transcriptional regulator [Trinickia violacea]
MSLPRLTGRMIAFSRFWLAREVGLLIADGAVIELGARAFAMLAALLDANGRVVSTAELREIVWPGSTVDANTVQAQISAIRRALDADRDLIVTVPGRGYRFAGEIRLVETPETALAPTATAGNTPPTTAATLAPTGAAASLRAHAIDPSPFTGRHAELSELLALVPTRRLVTLTGATGIGKTRLAIEAAARLAAQFPDGCVCAALGSLAHPDRVARAIAAAVGLEPNARLAELASLAAQIGERRILLIADHCDQLGEAAARTLDALLAATRGVHVIVTCETPLFIPGEACVPLAPLPVPPERGGDTAATLDCDALRLLLARLDPLLTRAGFNDARLYVPGLAETTIAAAALVCRRLDGVPFAIELAAAAIVSRVRQGVAAESAITSFAHDLDAMLTRRTGARRIVLPRAAMVAAMLDLRYDALDDATRTTLRRLGVFTGAFTREAAQDVLGALDNDDAELGGHLYAPIKPSAPHALNASFNGRLRMLIDAGLVNEVDCDGELRLRLPESVRRFALDALDRHRESAAAAAHHAQFVARDMERRFGAGLAAATSHTRHDIDALRAALEWTLAADKAELAAELLDHSATVWVALSLVDEYVRWARAALACVAGGGAIPAAVRHIRDEMRLTAVLARALTFEQGASAEIVESWQRTYELANICADMPYRVRALFCLVTCALDAGEIRRCRQLSDAFSEIASASQWPALQVNARRIDGIVTAYEGRFDHAIRLLSPVSGLVQDAASNVDKDAAREANAMATSYGLSLHVVARAMLDASRWFAGEPLAAPLPAMRREPANDSEPLAYCVSLSFACALAAIDDDVALAESCAAALVSRARVAGLRRWLRYGLDVQLWLDARRGDDEAARRLVGSAAKRIARERVYLLDIAFLTTLLPRIDLTDKPEFTASLGTTLRDASSRAERIGERWPVAPLLRLIAMLEWAGREDVETVRATLASAMQLAREQGARRLEVRVLADLDSLNGPEALDTTTAPPRAGLLRAR